MAGVESICKRLLGPEAQVVITSTHPGGPGGLHIPGACGIGRAGKSRACPVAPIAPKPSETPPDALRPPQAPLESSAHPGKPPECSRGHRRAADTAEAAERPRGRGSWGTAGPGQGFGHGTAAGFRWPEAVLWPDKVILVKNRYLHSSLGF